MNAFPKCFLVGMNTSSLNPVFSCWNEYKQSESSVFLLEWIQALSLNPVFSCWNEYKQSESSVFLLEWIQAVWIQCFLVGMNTSSLNPVFSCWNEYKQSESIFTIFSLTTQWKEISIISQSGYAVGTGYCLCTKSRIPGICPALPKQKIAWYIMSIPSMPYAQNTWCITYSKLPRRKKEKNKIKLFDS